MKKSFFFAAIAAVALVSCSEDSIVPNNDVQNPEELGLVPVELGIGRTLSAVTKTRGTGTVGSKSDTDNAWHFENLHVLMTQIPDAERSFGFTTIPAEGNNEALGEQFNNTFFSQPIYEQAKGAGDHGVGLNYLLFTGNRYRYYPQSGYSEFFAYYIDDAYRPTTEGLDTIPLAQSTDGNVHPNINVGEKEMTVNFKINGSQDLMAGRAINFMNEKAYDGSDSLDLQGNPVKKRGFSAKTARANVTPNIEMSHLLTRLTFGVKVGHASARGVKIDSIRVKSLTEGKMIVAYDTALVEKLSADTLIQWEPTDTLAFLVLRDTLPGQITANTIVNDTVTALGNKALLTDTAQHVISATAPVDTIAKIGDALFVNAGVVTYPMVIHVSYPHQTVDELNNPITRYLPESVPVTLKMGNDQTFEVGNSYHVNITIYGRSDIKVEATLEKWEDGGTISIDTEDPENPTYTPGV